MVFSRQALDREKLSRYIISDVLITEYSFDLFSWSHSSRGIVPGTVDRESSRESTCVNLTSLEIKYGFLNVTDEEEAYLND